MKDNLKSCKLMGMLLEIEQGFCNSEVRVSEESSDVWSWDWWPMRLLKPLMDAIMVL